jgi:hypothetical protein
LGSRDYIQKVLPYSLQEALGLFAPRSKKDIGTFYLPLLWLKFIFQITFFKLLFKNILSIKKGNLHRHMAVFAPAL